MTVRDACCNFLRNQLHPANCLGIRRFSDVHGCEDLRLEAHQFALQHFLDVRETEEFLMLAHKDVIIVVTVMVVTVIVVTIIIVLVIVVRVMVVTVIVITDT